MARTRFQVALKEIVKFFNKQERNVFTFTELGDVLDEKRDSWRLPFSMSARRFIAELLKCTILKEYTFKFMSLPAPIHRYTWGDSDIYALTSHLFKNSYLCHYTALYLHNLTEQDPKAVYINNEQTAKPQNNIKLSQSGIDSAFSKPHRITNNVCMVDGYQIHLLSGKHTGNLGVVDSKYRLSNLERTLIDITVRPYYSGGVFEVLKAYELARDSLSVSYLATLLNKIEYIYPYHQAIGFYLERAGYNPDQVAILEKYPREFNFYLANNMEEMDFSEKWQIYYPKGF